MKKVYFAYGSNMDLEGMKVRTPNAENWGHAVLKDYTLKERRYADIEKCEGAEVHGVAWTIDEADERALDRYEGFPLLYYKTEVTVQLKHKRWNGLEVDALVYIMTEDTVEALDGERFFEDYMEVCEGGALANNVPVHEFFKTTSEKVVG